MSERMTKDGRRVLMHQSLNDLTDPDDQIAWLRTRHIELVDKSNTCLIESVRLREQLETLQAQHRALVEKNEQMRAALREAIEWNWLEDTKPPVEVIAQINEALLTDTPINSPETDREVSTAPESPWVKFDSEDRETWPEEGVPVMVDRGGDWLRRMVYMNDKYFWHGWWWRPLFPIDRPPAVPIDRPPATSGENDMSIRCEGWIRRGGVFTLGPVRWEQCENDAVVTLTVDQFDTGVQDISACMGCWNRGIEEGITIKDVQPIATSGDSTPDTGD